MCIFFSHIFAECSNVTIISDPSAKNACGLDGVTVQAFRGDTISKVAKKIQHKQADLIPYDFVILHAGTKDIGYRAPYGDIISDFGNIIGICKKMKPSIQIIVSAI